MSNRRDTISYTIITPVLLCLCLMSAVAYVYFLNMSVVHVVVQKSTMGHIQDLKNEIALLEADFIAAQHTIAERMATIDGLEAEQSKIFVVRDTADEFVMSR